MSLAGVTYASEKASRDGLLAALGLLFCVALPARACWEEAGLRYGVHPHLLYAIARTESQLNPEAVHQNSDGSTDLGLMQINSRWLPQLRHYGIDAQRLRQPCVSIHVAAWILAQNMQRLGNSWTAVGAYNSSQPQLRIAYAQKVIRNLPAAPHQGSTPQKPLALISNLASMAQSAAKSAPKATVKSTITTGQ